MQSSSEQPLVREERYVKTLIMAAKETRVHSGRCHCMTLTNTSNSPHLTMILVHSLFRTNEGSIL